MPSAASLDTLDRSQEIGASSDTLARPWLQVLPHLDPVYGGLCAVVPRLSQELREHEAMAVEIAAFCSPEESRYVSALDQQHLSVLPLSRSAWLFDAALKARFQATIAGSSGVHIHGLWESSTFVVAPAARRLGVPYVLSAHGMLERWALRNKRLKKAVYAAIAERKNVCEAACLHALTAAEADDYRRFGCKGPIAIIPNGVEAPAGVTGDAFLAEYPQARDRKLLLFLGRIHFKKGVDLLVNAWAQLAAEFPDALLVLAGPDSEGSLSAVTEAVTRLRLQDRVLFTGMLNTTMKWSALAAATCFVLPSYSEGLSVAALEAMSMGVPLVLSHECNLPEVEKQGTGWLVTTDVPSLSHALRAVLLSTPEQLTRVASNAKAVAARDFSWKSVATRMAAVYRWVNGGPEPIGVELLRKSA